jgi:hypothetical protein
MNSIFCTYSSEVSQADQSLKRAAEERSIISRAKSSMMELKSWINSEQMIDIAEVVLSS